MELYEGNLDGCMTDEERVELGLEQQGKVLSQFPWPPHRCFFCHLNETVKINYLSCHESIAAYEHMERLLTSSTGK